MARRMRDITRALYLATIIRDKAGDEYSPEFNNELVKILTDLDARKGGREKGKGPALTPVRRRAKR